MAFLPNMQQNLGVVVSADTTGFARQMGGATAALSKFKLGATAATAAVAALGVMVAVKAVKAAAEFQQAMARVKSVSRATATEFAALTKKAKELGKTTKWTMSEIAAGEEFLARAGYSAIEIVEAMSGVSDLASATAMDLAEAADITSNALKGMRLEASQSTRVADVFALTTASANVNVHMLGESFKYVAPLWAAADWSVEQLSATIGRLGDAGIQGSMAGTSLRMAVTKLIGQTDKFKKKLNAVNLSMEDLTDSQGRLKSFADIIGVFEDAGLEAADMIALFGRRAGPALTILLNEGRESLMQFTGELENAGGTAQDMAEIQLDTLEGKVTILKSSLDLLWQTIGEDLTPRLEDVVENITAIINATTDWIAGNEELIPTLSTIWEKLVDISGAQEAFGPLTAKWGGTQEEVLRRQIEWWTEFGKQGETTQNIIADLSRRLDELLEEKRVKAIENMTAAELEFMATSKQLQEQVEGTNKAINEGTVAFEGYLESLSAPGALIPGFTVGPPTWREFRTPPPAPTPPGTTTIDKLYQSFDELRAQLAMVTEGTIEQARIYEELGKVYKKAVNAQEALTSRNIELSPELKELIADLEGMGFSTKEVSRKLKKVTDALTPFEQALEDVIPAAIAVAPTKVAEKLKHYAERDLVATADRTRELIRRIEEEIRAQEMFGWATDEAKAKLNEFKVALGMMAPITRKLAAISVEDVLEAPIEFGKKLRDLAKKDIVAVKDKAEELIRGIEKQISAQEFWGQETKETTDLLGKFKETLGLITDTAPTWKERMESVSGLFGNLRSILGKLPGLMGEVATGLVDVAQSLMKGDIGGAISAIVNIITAFIRDAIERLEERKRELEEILDFYVSSFREIGSAVSSVVGSINVLGPLGDALAATVSLMANSLAMLTLEGIDLLRAGITSLIGFVTSLASVFSNLINRSDAYTALQEESKSVWKAIGNLLGEFLWPLVGAIRYLKEWLGIQGVINEELAEMAEIGVPSVWKRERRAWEAAAPGEPYAPGAAGGVEIPSWAVALGEKLGETIRGILEDLDISSWGDMLSRIREMAVQFWNWVTVRLPDWVSQVTSFLSDVWDAINAVYNWVSSNIDFGDLEGVWASFIEEIKNLIGFDAAQTELENVRKAIDSLKTTMKFVIAIAAGAIIGGIAASLTLMPGSIPAAIGGALTGGAIGGLVAGMFEKGGIVPGPIGAPQLAMVHGGETITPPGQYQTVVNEIHVYLGGEEISDMVIEEVQHKGKLGTGYRSTAAGLTRRY